MAHIKKIGDRKYLIRVSKGTGKSRTFINHTFRGTLSDARQLAREKETLVDSGLKPQSVLTFEAYLKLWLAAIKPKVAPRTYDGYKGYIERYAVMPIGKFALADIRTHHIQMIYIDIRKSPTTTRNLHAALNACFGYAVRREYIRTNPCKNVDLPRKQKKEIVVLNLVEGRRFREICQEMTNGVIFEFALLTGMRPEEYLALRWQDLSGNNVSVQQVMQYNRSGGGFYFDTPKTARSRRMIDIPDDLRRRLVEHRRIQNEHRLAMKGTWFNHDLIFPNEVGNPFAINNLTRRYLQPIIDKCDFGKHFTLYSLRHTCATILLMLGENPKTVADRLGHSSVVMTLDTYSHVLPHIQENATAKLDNVLRMKRS
jgi:integrase